MTMGNLDRIATLVAFLLLASMPAAVGQSQHARLDEEREARDLRVEKIRSKLAEVRKSEKRPTVALVLSGGGAKGAAHVGVIRYLESIGMPVDVVLGTSMGGLVGGLYSLGYDAGQLDTLIRGIDWDMALSDKVPRDYLSYTRVKYKEKFVVSFPFYYSKDDYIRQKEDDNRYPRRSDDQLHFGADQADASDLVKDNILGSLPSGMVYGQNVSNIFSSMSVGYQDEIDFYDLPIPFICVATDLVTGTAKIWTRGKINTALRSTMSIPGLFAPVKTDGMVLVDGGMRNNYPTDLARKIGADIIIGVNLSSGYRTYSEINNLGEIIDSGIDLMGRSSFESNVDIPDVTLKPDLTGYNMLSFTPASIDTIIRKGYESALAEAPALDSLLRLTGSAGTKLRNRKAEDLGARKVMIDGIEVTGVSDKESLFLQDRMKMFAGTRMGKDEIEDAVANIFGTNAFDYVNYELHGSQEPYRLELKCKKGPISQVGFGFRVDTEEIVSVLLNIGIGVQKIQGSMLDFTGKVGTNPYASLHYSYVAPKGMTLNAETSVRYTNRNTFSLGDNRLGINYFNQRTDLYLSNIRWSRFFFKTGIRSDYYRINSLMSEDVIGDYDFSSLTNNYFSSFIKGEHYSFDNGYFPTRGRSTVLSYEWIYGGLPHDIGHFHVLMLSARAVHGTEHIAFLPSVNIRYLIGDDVPVPYINAIGGLMPGRYIEQQVPFVGVSNAAAMQNILGVVGGEFRVRLSTNNYLSLMGNFAVSANDLGDFENFGSGNVKTVTGMGVQYAYNSIIGPLKANVNWSTLTHKVGLYLGVGFDF